MEQGHWVTHCIILVQCSKGRQLMDSHVFSNHSTQNHTEYYRDQILLVWLFSLFFGWICNFSGSCGLTPFCKLGFYSISSLIFLAAVEDLVFLWYSATHFDPFQFARIFPNIKFQYWYSCSDISVILVLGSDIPCTNGLHSCAAENFPFAIGHIRS